MGTKRKRKPTLVGVAEVAALLGVSRQVVTNWRVRKPAFPKPLVELKSGPVWTRTKIARWAQSEGLKVGATAQP